MNMQVSKHEPCLSVKQFIELILMWFKSGDIPTNRIDTQQFIESDDFLVFLIYVDGWCNKLGLIPPAKSDIVKVLHSLYKEELV